MFFKGGPPRFGGEGVSYWLAGQGVETVSRCGVGWGGAMDFWGETVRCRGMVRRVAGADSCGQNRELRPELVCFRC